MSTRNQDIKDLAAQEYQYGWTTAVEEESAPPGLSEDIVRWISAKKNEPDWLLEYRLKAFAHFQRLLAEERFPAWARVSFPPIDYQAISYYAAPKPKLELESLDDVDAELLATYEKLGIPLEEQKRLAGVAVDAIFDSVSVATTAKDTLAKYGVIFCSLSEAVQEHPELVRRYLGSVVPYTDNFYAALNAAVFSDGSFVHVPEGVRCPLELSTYFRINAANSGQFERTLIVAEDSAYVSYLEGARRHAGREPAARRRGGAGGGGRCEISTPRSRTGTPAMMTGVAASATSSPSAAVRGRNSRSPGPRWRRARPSPGSTPRCCSRATGRWASSTRWR